MPLWIPLLLCTFAALGLLAWWLVGRASLKHWQRLEEVLDALGEGREPVSFIFLNGGRFTRLSVKLERLALEQDRLRRSAEDEKFNLRTILSSMEEGVMIVDARHVLRLVNPSFMRLFSLGASPLGQTVLHTLREAAFEETVSAALTTAEPQTQEILLTGSQPPRTFAVHAVPMRDSSGLQRVLTIFRDVSRLKQLEEVRREFVANVSHELRTPLSIFHGYVETLLDNPDLPRSELKAILEILEKHTFRLNALVQDLLILARLESRQEVLQLEPIDLAECVTDIATDWAKKAAEKSITITREIAANLPPIGADPLRFEQVLNNLLDNAIKYTKAGGSVRIAAAAEDGEWIELHVEDTGVGIPPTDVPHIFERFYRADKARSREQGGTGLGLSIVKHIVQSHGGCVRAESTYGKGTAVILRWPVYADGEAE